MMDLARGMWESWAGSLTWDALAGLMLKVTVAAVLGHAALAALARASAATRHFVALTALLAIVALPPTMALARFAPAWELSAPLWPVAPESTITADLAPSGGDLAPSPSRAAPVDRGKSRVRNRPRGFANPVVVAPEGGAFTARRSTDPPERRPPLTPAAFALALLFVAAVLLSRLAAGLLAAGWLARRAEPVTDPRARRLLDSSGRRLGLTRRMGLKLDRRLRVPVVAGIRRPTLVIPGGALQWPDERLEAVFLHELAHVRRRDVLALVAGRWATAWFWFHPLVWTLARAARRECERACDDMVLECGLRPSAYAGHLLAIVRDAAQAGPQPDAALAFARRSSLEGRLLSVLRSGARRGPASLWARGWAGVGLVSVLAALGTLRVSAAPDAERAVASGGDSRAQAMTASPLKAPARTAAAARTKSETAWRTENAEVKRSHLGRATAPESGGSAYDTARERYEAGLYEQAGTAFQAAAERGYRPGTSWYNAACSFALAGEKLRALGALEHSIAAGYDDAGHIRTDDDLASIRSDGRFQLMLEGLETTGPGLEEKRSALTRYDTLRGTGSRDAEAWRSAGKALLRAGEEAQAADAFGRQAALDSSPSAIYNQACAYALGGDRAAAIRALEQAIVAGYGSRDKLESDSDLLSLHGDSRFEVLAQLADDLTLSHRGKDDDDEAAWRETVPRYQEVAREHPDLGRAWFNLGFAQLRAGNAPASGGSFTRALEMGYRPATTMYNLGCAAAQAGEAEEALRWLARAEKEGLNVAEMAPEDRDLDPLRSDPRFRAQIDRWERLRRAERTKDKEREKLKDKG